MRNAIMRLLLEEHNQPLRWFYLSFAEDEKFNGAVVIKAHGIGDACMKCHQLGISPGGEVLGFPIPDDELPSSQYHNRLLGREDVVEFWPDAKSIKEHEEEVK